MPFTFCVLLSLLRTLCAGQGIPNNYEERVSVDRVVVNAHVLDRSGAPISGLTIADFEVRVDHATTSLESVDWVGVPAIRPQGLVSPSFSAVESSRLPVEPATVPGRTIVILFQWEIAGQKQEGFLRMQRQAIEFVRGIQVRDRVAILLFSSRLFLRQDFTSDPKTLENSLRNILRSGDPRTNADSGPSLASTLSNESALGAVTIEKALLAAGQALALVPGKKSMIFFGWQIGRWAPTFRGEGTGYVTHTADYEPARRALARAEISVFCLDVSDGTHGLADGLDRLALDTGGFYLPTYLFPSFAMNKVIVALEGHYVLVFRKPGWSRGKHTIEISVPGRSTFILYRRFYDDAPR